MPSARPIVDVESVLRAYLIGVPAVTNLVGEGNAARIGQKLDKTFPRTGRSDLQLARVYGNDAVEGHLERAVVQLNAYGPDSTTAFALFAVTDLALRLAPETAHAGAVITKVERISGPTWSPDPPTDAPRYLSSFAVFIHPSPA